MAHSRFRGAFATLLLLACLFSCAFCDSSNGTQAETAYSQSQLEPSLNPSYKRRPGLPGAEALQDLLDDTYWYVPAAYLKAYLYLNGAQLPLLDQTVWHLRTAPDPDLYIFGRAVVSLFPANPPAGYQPSYACNSILGSITPSGSVYISFIPTSSANGTAVTTGLGSFGKFKQGGWAFEMQMGSGNPDALAAHWAYMLQCKRGEPCFSSLPGVGISIPEFMSKCGF